MEKSYEDMYHSLPHVSVITVNILITIIRFARYHLLLASSRTFITDSMYLGKIQICRNLNKQLFNFNYIRDLSTRRKFSSIPVAGYASFSHQTGTLKTNLLGLISDSFWYPTLKISKAT